MKIAPKSIRGLLTIQYAAYQQLGVVFGFFINYGVTKSYAGTNTQWMLPTLLQLLPASIWGLGIFFCPESPRWLLYIGKREQAMSNLGKLRHLPVDHPVLLAEVAGMDARILHETEAVGNPGLWELLKETLVPVENRRRFFLIFMATLFSQWSGANAITQYSPTIFGYLGISGDESKFLATGIYAIVKFVSTLAFALFVVDFIGRRRSLLTGICLQIITLAYVGGHLGGTKDMTASQITNSPNAARASTGAIVAIYFHAVAWSIGWFSIPYLIGSEIFPTKIRSFNMSIAMGFHWAFYFGCSRAMPSLLAASQKWGAFVFFGCICLISLIYVYFAMPVSPFVQFLYTSVYGLLTNLVRIQLGDRLKLWMVSSSGPGIPCTESPMPKRMRSRLNNSEREIWLHVPNIARRHESLASLLASIVSERGVVRILIAFSRCPRAASGGPLHATCKGCQRHSTVGSTLS